MLKYQVVGDALRKFILRNCYDVRKKCHDKLPIKLYWISHEYFSSGKKTQELSDGTQTNHHSSPQSLIANK